MTGKDRLIKEQRRVIENQRELIKQLQAQPLLAPEIPIYPVYPVVPTPSPFLPPTGVEWDYTEATSTTEQMDIIEQGRGMV